jgi:hypothetical protein
MESGSNKSLYTLIAVVVFGIFLALSYFLFQDNLKAVLGSVMDKTSIMTSNKLDNNGVIATDSKHFTYVVTNGEVTITRYKATGPKDVVIPALIDSYPVTSIGDAAFNGIVLNSVVLPDTIISVGTYAFTACNLKSIDLGNSVVNLGHDSLAWNSLTTISIPSSVKFIGYATFHGNFFTELTIPNTVETLETCQGLPNITNLDETMFSAITTLTKVNIPIKFKSSLEPLKFIKTYHWDYSQTPEKLVVDSYLNSNIFNYY